MAVFARITKLGSGAYDTRHARVRPSIMQCVLAIRETVVVKPSRLNIACLHAGQSPPEREVCIRAKEGSRGGNWRGLVPRYLYCAAL